MTGKLISQVFFSGQEYVYKYKMVGNISIIMLNLKNVDWNEGVVARLIKDGKARVAGWLTIHGVGDACWKESPVDANECHAHYYAHFQNTSMTHLSSHN